MGSLRLTIAITRSKPSSTTKWNELKTHIKGLAEVHMCPLPGIKTIYLSLFCLILVSDLKKNYKAHGDARKKDTMSRGKEGKKNRLRYDKDVGAIRQNIYNNLNVKC